MGVLIREVQATMRFLVRTVAFVIAFAVVAWPFGGPFHLIHQAIAVGRAVADAVAAWAGFPGAL
jgi:hypothetical protein